MSAVSTGGPRYMRTFYMRIRVYAKGKKRQKLVICDDFASPPSRICDLNIS